MALSHATKDDIPKDAVIINEEEALAYQWNVISNWENRWDVWSLRYGPGILGAMSAATGIYVNNHYRRKVKLGSYGKASTYLPIVVIPAMFSVLTHKFFVQRFVILDQHAECPLCLQLRASVFQGGAGVIYPTILAPFAAFMFATRHYTYRLPSVIKEPLAVFKLWQNMTKPILPVLGAALAGQSMIAMYITYKEQMQNFCLQIKMKRLEQMAEEKQEEERALC
ncbi:uncharacterized protein LOC101459145 isoform X2 [Ceratitis capitata]|uniref:uncharacterized protein LOC101459145 isoform X2 n=1 Tax=Ceratitis capitata TaxID=7213 RepID=UPI000A1200B3|nr:uncharacterized protein LOC101459145 isoform X2 [Ceratitis capitata]